MATGSHAPPARGKPSSTARSLVEAPGRRAFSGAMRVPAGGRALTMNANTFNTEDKR